jgi:hypothetical protein
MACVVDLRQAGTPPIADELAHRRYEQVNATFRREIESVAQELKRKY